MSTNEDEAGKLDAFIAGRYPEVELLTNAPTICKRINDFKDYLKDMRRDLIEHTPYSALDITGIGDPEGPDAAKASCCFMKFKVSGREYHAYLISVTDIIDWKTVKLGYSVRRVFKHNKKQRISYLSPYTTFPICYHYMDVKKINIDIDIIDLIVSVMTNIFGVGN